MPPPGGYTHPLDSPVERELLSGRNMAGEVLRVARSVHNADGEPYTSLVRGGHAEFWQRVERHVRDRAVIWRDMLSAG